MNKIRIENVEILAKKYNDSDMIPNHIARVMVELNNIVRPVNNDINEFSWIKDPPLDSMLIEVTDSIQELLPSEYTLHYDNKQDTSSVKMHPYYIIEFLRSPTVDAITIAGHLIMQGLEGTYQPTKVVDQILEQTTNMTAIIEILEQNTVSLETRVKPFCVRKSDLLLRGISGSDSFSKQFEVAIEVLQKLYSTHSKAAFLAYCINESFIDKQIDIYKSWLISLVPSAFYYDTTGRYF